ncbi:DUF3243 domain-containing protein [Filobacillus milosensis]|uniref:DUF3243 domain-containing protein n=1 Tax=Filobacillus milosensis TaxID=94137 RepID=A0A4Y8II71_9BACI|nr:DUF3243 domain-containing protein [Filobacillus milosensis]TFB18918.1 DUF3243 domain-containing protein [Filobacillus milosensis]
MSNLNNHMSKMSDEKKDEILENFQYFKDYLGNKIETGEKLGLSDEALTKAAKGVGDFLASHESPRNREEYLLKELWKVSNDTEKEHLSHILVKFAQQTNS